MKVHVSDCPGSHATMCGGSQGSCFVPWCTCVCHGWAELQNAEVVVAEVAASGDAEAAQPLAEGGKDSVGSAAPDESMGHPDNAEKSQIANRLRTLAKDHGQRAVYMLSYDADFIHEVADRIWPAHRSIGNLSTADCWCALGKDHSWDASPSEAEGVQS